MNTKNFTLILCVLLSLSVVLLSGCERGRDLGVTDEMVTPSDTTTMATLKVGLIQPSEHYTSFAKGAKLAQAEINQAGGVLGMQVAFIERDNRPATGPFPDPTTAAFTVEAAKELIEMEKVIAILGPVYSTNAVEVAPISPIPVLPAATGANVTEAGDFIFLIGVSNAVQAETMAEFAVNTLGKKTAMTIHQDGDVYSIGLTKAFRTNFSQLGGTVVGDEEVYKVGDTTFSEQLKRILTANPDALFISSFAPEAPLLMKAAREIGIESVFLGSDGWEGDTFFTTLEDNAPLEGAYYTTSSNDPSTPGAQKFAAAYMAMFGSAPDGTALSGYDAMRILASAIEAVKSTDPVAIRDAIQAITDYEGAASIARFNEDRHAIRIKGVKIWTIRDGQKVDPAESE